MISTSELLELHNTICIGARYLVEQRGMEYSGDENTLGSFTNAAQIRRNKPSDICMSLIAVKCARLDYQLSKGNLPMDTVQDMINYLVYLVALKKDENDHQYLL